METLKSHAFDAAGSDHHLIITVHGIRTFGGWQERLESIITAVHPSVQFRHYKFGYFSVLAFLFPPMRRLVVRRFRKEMLVEISSKSWSRVDFVAHSFGTHLVAWGLFRTSPEQRPKVHTIIFASSALPVRFPWRSVLHDTGCRVVNDCARHDLVLALGQIILGVGTAGRIGFTGMQSERFRNRYFGFGHSGYFADDRNSPISFMSKNWLPLLTTDGGIPPAEDEIPTRPLYGFQTFLLNNLEPVKYALCAILLVVAQHFLKPVWTEASRNRQAQELIAAGAIIVRESGVNYLSIGTVPNPRAILTRARGLDWIGGINLDGSTATDADLTPLMGNTFIVSINLNNTRLGDETLRVIGTMQGLETLRLDDTSVSDRGIAYLAKLTKLNFLSLNRTMVTGASLSSIAKLNKLRVLRLTLTRVDDESMAQLLPLSGSLEILVLDYTPISDSGLVPLGRISSLKTLSVEGCKITDEGLSQIQNLAVLDALFLNNTLVKGAAFQYLGNLQKLTDLYLTSDAIEDKWCRSISQLQNLDSLWLKDTGVSDECLVELSPLQKLRILALPGDPISDKGLSSLVRLKNLRELYLGGTRITDAGLKELSNLPNLEVLFLPSTEITDLGLGHLQVIKSLRRMNVEETKVTIAGVKALERALPGLVVELPPAEATQK